MVLKLAVQNIMRGFFFLSKRQIQVTWVAVSTILAGETEREQTTLQGLDNAVTGVSFVATKNWAPHPILGGPDQSFHHHSHPQCVHLFCQQ